MELHGYTYCEEIHALMLRTLLLAASCPVLMILFLAGLGVLVLLRFGVFFLATVFPLLEHLGCLYKNYFYIFLYKLYRGNIVVM